MVLVCLSMTWSVTLTTQMKTRMVEQTIPTGRKINRRKQSGHCAIEISVNGPVATRKRCVDSSNDIISYWHNFIWVTISPFLFLPFLTDYMT